MQTRNFVLYLFFTIAMVQMRVRVHRKRWTTCLGTENIADDFVE